MLILLGIRLRLWIRFRCGGFGGCFWPVVNGWVVGWMIYDDTLSCLSLYTPFVEMSIYK